MGRVVGAGGSGGGQLGLFSVEVGGGAALLCLRQCLFLSCLPPLLPFCPTFSLQKYLKQGNVEEKMWMEKVWMLLNQKTKVDR